ncbi:MAG: hypothetical protein ABW146_17240 [Candidatus Sedimenticola sp. 6PFRAG7]
MTYSTTKPLPPYGSKVHNPSNGVWIYVGSKQAWRIAEKVLKNFPSSRAPLVLPDDASPDKYRWPVKGLDVMVVLLEEQHPDRIHHLGFELVKAGALRVFTTREDGNLPVRLTFFKPVKAEGVA